MFKLQANRLSSALDAADLPEDAKSELINVFANCTQALQHNGPVAIEYQHKPTQSRNFAPLMVKTAPGFNAGLFDGDVVINGDLYVNGSDSIGQRFAFYNAFDETIPAYGIMRMIPGATAFRHGRLYLGMVKPGFAAIGDADLNFQPLYYINSGHEVKPGHAGFCTTGEAAAIALVSSTQSSPARLAAAPDDWGLFGDAADGAPGEGFTILLQNNNGTAWVQQRRVETVHFKIKWSDSHDLTVLFEGADSGWVIETYSSDASGYAAPESIDGKGQGISTFPDAVRNGLAHFTGEQWYIGSMTLPTDDQVFVMTDEVDPAAWDAKVLTGLGGGSFVDSVNFGAGTVHTTTFASLLQKHQLNSRKLVQLSPTSAASH